LVERLSCKQGVSGSSPLSGFYENSTLCGYSTSIWGPQLTSMARAQRLAPIQHVARQAAYSKLNAAPGLLAERRSSNVCRWSGGLELTRRWFAGTSPKRVLTRPQSTSSPSYAICDPPGCPFGGQIIRVFQPLARVMAELLLQVATRDRWIGRDRLAVLPHYEVTLAVDYRRAEVPVDLIRLINCDLAVAKAH
jgi:hypothetical protein